MAGTTLKDINTYKNSVLSALLQSTDILTLLLGEGYTPEQVLGDNNGSNGVMYQQIFPYLYTEETKTEVKSYICMDVDSTIQNPHIKSSTLTIWVYCNKNTMKYEKEGYSGTRTDLLSDLIDRQLAQSVNPGLGRLLLKSAKYFIPAAGFYGRILLYEIPDFKTKNG